MARDQRIGAFRDRLEILSATPPAIEVVSLGRVGTEAIGMTSAPHGFERGDYVVIAGATPLGYNGQRALLDVPSTTEFSYVVSDTLATPAAGSITVRYKSNAQGGVEGGPWSAGALWGEVVALRASERLAAETVASTLAYRITTHYRPDLNETMTLEWRPYLEARPKELRIAGVVDHPDYPRQLVIIEATALGGEADA
jgi:head-tail adaptor